MNKPLLSIFILSFIVFPNTCLASIVDFSLTDREVVFKEHWLASEWEVAQEIEPNRDRFLQDGIVPSPPPPLAPEPLPPEPEITPEEPPLQPEVESPEQRQETFFVSDVEIVNSSFSEELESIVQPLEERTVTRLELEAAVDAITQFYVERGFLTSRAVLDEGSLNTGIVQINVIEGSLEAIEVEGTQRLADYVRSRVRLAGTPLNVAEIEDQLRLLRADPLFDNISASLRPSGELGKSILIVRVTEADPINITVGINNYSPPSIGGERAGASLSYLNLLGLGDSLAVAYTQTTIGASETVEVNYQVPVNAMNGVVDFRAAFGDLEVKDEEFEEFDIRDESELFEISYRQPLIRSPRQEFALSFGFTFQEGQTFTFAGPTPFGFGPDEEGISRTSVFKFGQDYTSRGASGVWALRSQFNFGTGLFDATINGDPDPDSLFFSWLAQVQRVQFLTEDNFLIFQLDFQLTPDSLLPSEQFIIGGGQSVRGFRQNVRAGDLGFRFSIEDRITLIRDAGGEPTFQLAPFFDAGLVGNAGDNPNSLPDDTFIAGLGLGLLWELFPGLNARLDYGLPLIDIDDRGDSIQDDGLYFSVTYGFDF